MSAWHEQADQPQQIVDANGVVWIQYDRLTELDRVWVRADGTSEMPLPGRAIENQYGPCKPLSKITGLDADEYQLICQALSLYAQYAQARSETDTTDKWSQQIRQALNTKHHLEYGWAGSEH